MTFLIYNQFWTAIYQNFKLKYQKFENDETKLASEIVFFIFKTNVETFSGTHGLPTSKSQESTECERKHLKSSR